MIPMTKADDTYDFSLEYLQQEKCNLYSTTPLFASNSLIINIHTKWSTLVYTPLILHLYSTLIFLSRHRHIMHKVEYGWSISGV